MKNVFLLLGLSLATVQSQAMTCQVQNYNDQSALVTKEVNGTSQVLLKENGHKYQVSLLDENRYALIIIDPNSKGLAAMGVQGYELTLANEALNRTIGCK